MQAICLAGMLCAVFCAAGRAEQRTLGLQASAQTVGRYEKIEFTLSGIGEYANPFDPYEVDIMLEFTTPRGGKLRLPAFYEQEYRREQHERGGRPADWFYPVGRPVWKARFAPSETGRYSCVARLRDRNGTAQSKPVTFSCVPSTRKGYVRASPQDRRFLAFDDGSPFFAVGQNAAFVKELRDTEAIFRHMAAQGANFARIWTCCDDWGMAIEARKSAWGRSWDWKPPLVTVPGREGDPAAPKCVRVAGGAVVPVSPSQPVALRPSTRYVVSGLARTDEGAALVVEINDARPGEPIAGARDWQPFRREFTTPENGWWLEGIALRASGRGAAWVRDLSLREAEGKPELLWEADVNRPVMGNYNPTDCYILDKVVEAAEASGICLQLCVLTRDLYMDRLKNESAPEYDRAVADARRLLRYAVARWGYSTSVAAWEYWNEMNPGLPTDRFYTELGQFLAQTDIYHHLRDTSTWSDCPRDWHLPALDIANMHYYLRPADGERFKDEVTTVRERCRTLRKEAPDKPALFAEFGLAKDDWQPSPYMGMDSGYVHLHNALWTSALSGLSGTVMPWWWEDIEKQDAYRHYRAVAAFVRDIPFTTGRMREAAASPSDARWRVVGLQGIGGAYLWLSDAQAAWWRQVAEKTPPAESKGVSLTVEGLAPGAYRVEWWNTAEGTVVKTEEARVSDKPLLLRAPAFVGDIACKAVRQQ
jgi:hypothetical protein